MKYIHDSSKSTYPPVDEWVIGASFNTVSSNFKFGNGCIEFTSANSYAYTRTTTPYFLNEIVQNNSSWTIGFWINLSTISASPYGVLFYYGQNTLASLLSVRITSGRNISFVQNEGTANRQEITSTNTIIIGTWHFIAMSRSGSDIHCYLDGNRVGVLTNTQNPVLQYIVVGSDGGYLNYTGFMDSFFIKTGNDYSTPTITLPTSSPSRASSNFLDYVLILNFDNPTIANIHKSGNHYNFSTSLSLSYRYGYQAFMYDWNVNYRNKNISFGGHLTNVPTIVEPYRNSYPYKIRGRTLNYLGAPISRGVQMFQFGNLVTGVTSDSDGYWEISSSSNVIPSRIIIQGQANENSQIFDNVLAV